MNHREGGAAANPQRPAVCACGGGAMPWGCGPWGGGHNRVGLGVTGQQGWGAQFDGAGGRGVVGMEDTA